MREQIAEVLTLQGQWVHENTPSMQRRGVLIRDEMTSWLRDIGPQLASSLSIPLSDLKIEGRDGTGQKSEIPWVRYCSRTRSPSAHDGWYCAYLFSAGGEEAYLCLTHASTRYQNGEFKPRPNSELAELAQWARSLIGSMGKKQGLLENISLSVKKGSLGAVYERGTAFAIKYSANNLPDDGTLAQDALQYAGLLKHIYDAEDLGRSPDATYLDNAAIEHGIELIASPQRASRSFGQGFGLTYAERCSVDKRAMAVAKEVLIELGYRCKDVSKKSPFDYLAKKGDSAIIVEVKGTTGGLRSILLTANEVKAHQEKFPLNALIVVHSIELDRSLAEPVASGGVPHLIHPWRVDTASLKALSYQYALTL